MFSRHMTAEIIPYQTPRPRYNRGDVPIGFLPVYVPDSHGNKSSRYRCDLDGHPRQCSWVGKKSLCANQTHHTYTSSPDKDPLIRGHSVEIRHRKTESTNHCNRGCVYHPDKSQLPARNISGMHEFIVSLIQLGVSLPW
jgi:hypothetical protein